MKIKILGIVSVVLVFGFATLSLTASQNETSSSASNVETFQLTSKTFSNTRTIRVLLPPGYRNQENATKRYPVIYLNDGVMVFRPDRINIEEMVYKLIGDKEMPPIIVVGIDNGGSTDKTKNSDVDRTNEFLPYPDAGFGPSHLNKPEPPNPQGKLYPAFLVDEVMPMIQQRYRVKAGQSNTAVGGFSYGGVAALYAVMTRPEVFGKLLLESTPLWIGPDRQFLRDVGKIRKWPAVVYLGIGTKESPDEAITKEARQDIESFHRIIAKRSPGTTLKVVSAEGGTHDPSSWRSRLPSALRFLFGSEGK